ncbi:hypothetical protein AVEN_219227-1 [Araneus ventricosus]|uniref:Uncharacterized protein n=1 Tax=Araneus ventricosus TaxID=182803 RepID=A0A4Y2WN66_ARAVE|nr:hypothetical protein AVEN_219227-1 [Araneus ventricosus]
MWTFAGVRMPSDCLMKLMSPEVKIIYNTIAEKVKQNIIDFGSFQVIWTPWATGQELLFREELFVGGLDFPRNYLPSSAEQWSKRGFRRTEQGGAWELTRSRWSNDTLTSGEGSFLLRSVRASEMLSPERRNSYMAHCVRL